MGLFDEVNKKFGKWIQVLDSDNTSVTIEDFDYAQGVHGEITAKHCDKCVSVNKCWFKDEKDKKPEPYPILGIEVLDDFANAVTPGLYHFKCHCYESGIMTPNVEDVKLIIPEGKEGWLFKDKQDWIRSLGYDNNDEFLKVIYKLIKQAYCDGDYKIKNHDKHGVKIDLYLTLPGAGSKLGRSYPVKSAFMIFPNGKLKCNTILGGRQ
jgi:hypothetical protein